MPRKFMKPIEQSKLFLKIVIGLLMFLNSSAYAVQEQFQTWSGVSLYNNITNDWLYNFTTQSRTIPTENKINQVLYIPTVGYQLVPKSFIFWFGFTYTSTNVDEDAIIAGSEQRPWQRLDWNLVSSSHVRLLLGNRIEERKEDNFSSWAYRWRERATLSFPNTVSATVTPTLYDEAFFNLNQPVWVAQTTFEQNRFYGGFNFSLSNHINFDLGYLNQYQFRDPENQMNNILLLQLNIQT